jgi:anti-anti-sigma factor
VTQVTPEEKGDRLVIRVSGRFDAAGAKLVGDALEQALKTGRHAVELDMGEVDYLSSAGMRILIIYHRKFSQLRGRFYLSSVGDRVGKVLEMTGLYTMMDIVPEQDGQDSPGQHRVSFDGWDLTFSEPEPGGILLPRVIGARDPEGTAPPDESRPGILPFPPTVLAFGTGALGYEAGDCAGRYGPFLAAGGFAAFQPLQGDPDPDYVEYAETDIPLLHVLDAISLAGSYSHQVSFESDTMPPGPGELVQALLAAGTMPAAGFVIAAECERAGDGSYGDVLQDKNGETAPGGGTAQDKKMLCLMLAVGVAGVPGMTDLSGKQLFPAGAGTDIMTHLHAAFFPYKPLRRRGPVKLKDTITSLFDQEVQEVVHLEISPGRPGKEGLCLLRGLAWFATVQVKNR